LLCFTALALAACVKSADPAPTPGGAEGKPPSWDDQSDRDWLYRSQFKTHMRHLWINSNRVASAGRGSAEPTWHEIRAGAEDIRNRARMLGGYWQQLRESTETMLECVEDEDRFGATLEFRELGAACDGCHMATWSPAYLHVTNKVVQGWLANKPTPHGVEEVDDNP